MLNMQHYLPPNIVTLLFIVLDIIGFILAFKCLYDLTKGIINMVTIKHCFVMLSLLILLMIMLPDKIIPFGEW